MEENKQLKNALILITGIFVVLIGAAFVYIFRYSEDYPIQVFNGIKRFVIADQTVTGGKVGVVKFS